MMNLSRSFVGRSIQRNGLEYSNEVVVVEKRTMTTRMSKGHQSCGGIINFKI
jgi:hypothetical protein